MVETRSQLADRSPQSDVRRRCTSANCEPRTANQRGFTLIELIVVVTIIGILAAVAVANVKNAQTKAREAALKDDLFEMRKAIDNYYADKQKYPDGLQTLVSEKYLRAIPKDPITMKADWVEIQNSTDPNDPTATDTSGDAAQAMTPGVSDVHSNATGNGLDGTPYKDW
ncbi:MAG TPA: type II secretion system protein [Thermoanaerobaculia bacterium]|nr:type II secretion system protein [Thermoanaerobaculia bacterium]